MDADVRPGPTRRQYSPEQKEHAVRMVLALRAELGRHHPGVPPRPALRDGRQRGHDGFAPTDSVQQSASDDSVFA